MSQISRKLSRKILFQRLYADCFYKNSNTLFLQSFFEGKFNNEIDEAYILEMHSIILAKESEFLYIIEKFAPKFNITSMHLIYILPIFIGIAEMIYLKEEIPVKVSLNEGIELAKIYADESGKRIVNGILNKIFENYENIKNDRGKEVYNKEFSFFIR
jgi:N utilization substance protein B